MTFNLENVTTVNIVDVHDTLIAYATPGFGPQVIIHGMKISPRSPVFRQSGEAVDAFLERHNIKTPDEELVAEEAAVKRGLEYLSASEDPVHVTDEYAHYMIPIEGAVEYLRHKLEDNSQVVAIVASSTVEQSIVTFSYLLGEEAFERYRSEGKLLLVNAVHPLSDETPAMGKKNPETWKQSYTVAGLDTIAANVEQVDIFENGIKNREAALEAAKEMFKNAKHNTYENMYR